MKEQIKEFNRNPKISDWFNKQLDYLIDKGVYTTESDLEKIRHDLIENIKIYCTQWNIRNVSIGMSGGIDSALTASLFADAGMEVTGLVMPIHQDEAETDRGIETCHELNIHCHQVDLTETYEHFRRFGAGQVDPAITFPTASITEKDTKVRLGNIRARLRMNTLYNHASLTKGVVASTDNFSELAAGFWTLHGDVGDIAPIQSLTKSWEVPALAKMQGVPNSVIEAKPTDGLGIANGDEDQFGFSYLEFDIALFSLFETYDVDFKFDMKDERDISIIDNVRNRVRSTVYKRRNPFNLQYPLEEDRYSLLEDLNTLLLIRRK